MGLTWDTTFLRTKQGMLMSAEAVGYTQPKISSFSPILILRHLDLWEELSPSSLDTGCINKQ